VATTNDQRFAILSVSDRGKRKRGNALYFRDLSKKREGVLRRSLRNHRRHFVVVDNLGEKFLIATDQNAPKGSWCFTIRPTPKLRGTNYSGEGGFLDNVESLGGKTFRDLFEDVASRVYVYNNSGTARDEIELPGRGSGTGFRGNSRRQGCVFLYTSFNYPRACSAMIW